MAEGTRGLDIKKLEVQLRDQEKAVQRVSNRTDEIANKTDDLLKLVATIASQQSAMMQMMQSFGMNSGGSSVSSHDRDEQEPFNQPANQIPHQGPQQRPIHFGKVEFPPWRLYRCDHFFANETPENLKLRYNFNKVAQYKQLTLKEAEEKMKNRKKTADGDDDEGNASDRGAGDDDEDGSSRKSKLRSGDDDDDDDEAPRGRDPDMEDEEEEKGDDWEHDEHFSDDDEHLDVEEEREDLANEAVPPEIKDDENEEDTPASKGKRKLNSDDGEPCSNAPSSKKTKNDSSEAKSSAAKDEQQHPSKGASKSSSDSKAAAAATGPVTGEEIKSFLMQNTPVTTKALVDKFKDRLRSKEEKVWFLGIFRTISPDSKAATNPVTEEEIKSLLMQNTPVTTKALVDKFRDRLRSKEEKDSFVGIIKKIIKIQKINGSYCAVLR